MAVEIYRADEIINMFKNHDSGIFEYIEGVADEIYNSAEDNTSAGNIICSINKIVVDDIFRHNAWLDLYKSCKSFYIPEEIGYDSYKESFIDMLGRLFCEYSELFPCVNNDKIQEVILHILNNPESNLKQKIIAAEFYINSSYLSTVFFCADTASLCGLSYYSKAQARRLAFAEYHHEDYRNSRTA